MSSGSSPVRAARETFYYVVDVAFAQTEIFSKLGGRWFQVVHWNGKNYRMPIRYIPTGKRRHAYDGAHPPITIEDRVLRREAPSVSCFYCGLKRLKLAVRTGFVLPTYEAKGAICTKCGRTVICD